MNMVTLTGEIYREPKRFMVKTSVRGETPIWTFNLKVEPNYFDDKYERPPIVRIKLYGQKWYKIQYRLRLGTKIFVKGILQTSYSKKEKDGVATIEFVSYVFADDVQIFNDFRSRGNEEQSEALDRLEENIGEVQEGNEG